MALFVEDKKDNLIQLEQMQSTKSETASEQKEENPLAETAIPPKILSYCVSCLSRSEELVADEQVLEGFKQRSQISNNQLCIF